MIARRSKVPWELPHGAYLRSERSTSMVTQFLARNRIDLVQGSDNGHSISCFVVPDGEIRARQQLEQKIITTTKETEEKGDVALRSATNTT